MKILIVGATGATGRLLVEQLLQRGHQVHVIVRSAARLPEAVRNHERLSTTEAELLALSDDALAELVQDCDAVASCLGHTISFKGIFGHPRRLVTDSVRRLCAAIKANQPVTPTKFVLMNTVGNRNRDWNEPVTLGETMVFGLLRLLLPPHVDNEEAADYLRTQIGQQDKTIEWAAVRPDSLLDEAEVTPYDLHPSPRYTLFKPGQTSRINVAHLMANLITRDDLWQTWKGQMPVIYNRV